MAKKKSGGSLPAIDRQIKTVRTKLSTISKKERIAKQIKKKKATLIKLKNQLATKSRSVRKKR